MKESLLEKYNAKAPEKSTAAGLPKSSGPEVADDNQEMEGDENEDGEEEDLENDLQEEDMG